MNVVVCVTLTVPQHSNYYSGGHPAAQLSFIEIFYQSCSKTSKMVVHVYATLIDQCHIFFNDYNYILSRT